MYFKDLKKDDKLNIIYHVLKVKSLLLIIGAISLYYLIFGYNYISYIFLIPFLLEAVYFSKSFKKILKEINRYEYNYIEGEEINREIRSGNLVTYITDNHTITLPSSVNWIEQYDLKYKRDISIDKIL